MLPVISSRFQFFQLGFLRRLFGVCTTDEDGNQAYDFKDGLGRTILAGHIDGSEPYFTHYEYDSRDDLVGVYPPSVAYETPGPAGASNRYKQLFLYCYDFLALHNNFRKCGTVILLHL